MLLLPARGLQHIGLVCHRYPTTSPTGRRQSRIRPGPCFLPARPCRPHTRGSAPQAMEARTGARPAAPAPPTSATEPIHPPAKGRATCSEATITRSARYVLCVGAPAASDRHATRPFACQNSTGAHPTKQNDDVWGWGPFPQIRMTARRETNATNRFRVDPTCLLVEQTGAKSI